MSNNILPVKGTHDIFGLEMDKYNFILDKFYKVSAKFNFQSIQTPIIEHQELFSRSVGEDTDIVSKEMYSFVDKGDTTICLRPEATSSLARFAASNYQSGQMKLSTQGPMFRRERPQKGRYRQFHQINIENIGEKSSYIDFEIILIASTILKELGLVADQYKLLINSLGSSEDQINYSKILSEYLNHYRRNLSETSLARLKKNPLRILDSKDKSDKDILLNAPKINEYLSKESQNFFNDIKLMLTDNNILFKEDEKLVRGLDYYTHTAFEFQTNEEKRQNAILAGGRYDKLINMISSRDIPGIGWAAGVERLSNLLSDKKNYTKIPKKILYAVQYESYLSNSSILKQIYSADITHEIKVNKNIKKLFTYADKNKFNFILLIGEEEFKSQSILLKNLDDKSQKLYKQNELLIVNEIR
ncbi:MAG: histidine--tRNA ligase [Alphaproteobacteria bacterium]